MRLVDGLTEFLFPTTCAGCEFPGWLVCPRCVEALPLIAVDKACTVCGSPECRRRCPECDGTPFAFSSARCAGVFEHPLSRILRLYKDAGERRLATPLGSLLHEAFGDWRQWADALTFVPASAGARLRRGFDHSQLLAGELSRASGLPLLATLECRARKDQRRLGRSGRTSNAGEAFTVVADPPPLARLVLVDDVLTTGSTLDSASRVLRRAGAQEVRALAVARACRC